MIVTSPSQLRYDEQNHIGLTQLVATNGWRDALLSPKNSSAAGPLYPGNSPDAVSDYALATAGDSMGKLLLFPRSCSAACKV